MLKTISTRKIVAMFGVAAILATSSFLPRASAFHEHRATADPFYTRAVPTPPPWVGYTHITFGMAPPASRDHHVYKSRALDGPKTRTLVHWR